MFIKPPYSIFINPPCLGELTLVKDPSTESSLNPPEQEKSSLFDSPFKR